MKSLSQGVLQWGAGVEKEIQQSLLRCSKQEDPAVSLSQGDPMGPAERLT